MDGSSRKTLGLQRYNVDTRERQAMNEEDEEMRMKRMTITLMEIMRSEHILITTYLMVI
jgi:6-phosphogluconolactonase/glucosamine-6-phosphate isomerase/deaminase